MVCESMKVFCKKRYYADTKTYCVANPVFILHYYLARSDL